MKGFVTGAVVVLALDQLTKLLARRFLEPGRALASLGEFVRLRYVENPGAAFGLLPGNRLLFILISVVSVAIILYLVLARRHVCRGSGVAFGLICGGALGNLIDRMWLSGVIDFLDVGIGRHRWPTFNVADAGVTLGVLYLAAGALVLSHEPEEKPRVAAGPEDV